MLATFYQRICKKWRVCGMLFVLLLAVLLCHAQTAFAQNGKLLSDNTKDGYSKSNQSKVFYHGGKWWALAFADAEDTWAIWQLNDSTWSYAAAAGNTSSSAHPDAVLNAATNKLYVLYSAKSSQFIRMSFSGGTWSIDAGYPVTLTALGKGDSQNPASLALAKNGELWIFRINNETLQTMHSTNEGATWSALINVKSGLNTESGLTDARAFTSGGQNFVGVAYGEEDTPGVSRYGFLFHQDGAVETAWTDESASLTVGAENATSNISMAVDAANNLFLLTQNANATGSNARNTLYKRAAAGGWQSFSVNTSQTWTAPAVAVSSTNKLFLLGINTTTFEGEYKSLTIGQENTASAALSNPLFDNSGEQFANLSAPAQIVDATSHLLITCENISAGLIWYNRLNVGGGGPGPGPGPSCPPVLAAGPAAIEGTRGGSSVFYKPNQSKVFYHANAWWVAAQDTSGKEWFLYKKQGANWIKSISLGSPGSLKPDCIVDSPNNKLYVLQSHTSNDGTKFLSLTYSTNTGAWSYDVGFPVAILGFKHQGENPCVLIRAKNGDFWVFVARLGVIYARRSSNGGVTWTPDIIVKTIDITTAMVDVVTFTSNGKNYIGLGYAEDTDPISHYGFIHHKDGDADNVWTDETHLISVPPNTYGDDHMSMAVSPNNDVYIATKTNPDLNNATGIALYKRTPAGVWSMRSVFIGSAETRPALAIDETNNELYVFALRLGSPRYGLYKKCRIGFEDSLAIVPGVTYMQEGMNDFHNLSTPAHYVNSCTGLLVAGENNTNFKTWYQLFSIKGNNAPLPVVVDSTIVTPTTVNQKASYKIKFTLGATGALTTGVDQIIVTWPEGTRVPSVMLNTNVKVNGVNASAVTTDSLARQATVTVPANILASTQVTLLFAKAAGVFNPTLANTHTLQLKTSMQPTDATSPTYSITGSVGVAVGTIIVTPDTATRIASYQIPITLGASGALTGGLGKIMVKWPTGFALPTTIAKTNVKVNNVNAFAVAVNLTNRVITITVPNNLANNAAVTVLFTSAAAIGNPALVGDYSLQAKTSIQTTFGTSPLFAIKALPTGPANNTGALLAKQTKAVFDKSSQSKIFYHDSKWWTIAQDSSDSKWYLWYHSGAAWARSLKVDSRAGSRADMLMDSATNRLYILSSQGSSTIFFRYLYSAGTWAAEATVTLLGFHHGDGANVITMTRAKNNALWVFRIALGALETQVSTDDGNTWSSTIQIKTGMTGINGQTDAVAFSQGGDHVGVFYSMTAASGGTAIGFFKHLDSAPNATWTDESASINFFGTEGADSWVSANTLANGTVYVITRNKTGGASDPTNTLYKRSTAGTWSKFKINTGSNAWTSPTLAIDATSNRLLVLGIRTSAPSFGEYKICAVGSEATLEAALAKPVFKNNTDNFGHMSAPLAEATNATGLMLVASNTTTDDLWFNKLNLSLAKEEAEDISVHEKTEAEIDNFKEAGVYPNPFNPTTSIRFAVQTPTSVKLQIFNLRGELVRTLANGDFQRGVYERVWNGRDHTGNLSASGIYFYRLQIGEKLYRGRMQMLK